MIPIVGNTRALEILESFKDGWICRVVLSLQTRLALQLAISSLRLKINRDEDFVSGQRNAAGQPPYRPSASSI